MASYGFARGPNTQLLRRSEAPQLSVIGQRLARLFEIAQVGRLTRTEAGKPDPREFGHVAVVITGPAMVPCVTVIALRMRNRAAMPMYEIATLR